MCSDEKPRLVIMCAPSMGRDVGMMLHYLRGALAAHHIGIGICVDILESEYVPEHGLVIERVPLLRGEWVDPVVKTEVKIKGVKRSYKPSKYLNHYS